MNWAGERGWRLSNWRYDARWRIEVCHKRVVYGLCSSADGVVRYVGSTRRLNDRLLGHVCAARCGGQLPVNRWVASVLAAGFRVRAVVLIEEGCLECERHEIQRRYLAGEPLLNVRDNPLVDRRQQHQEAA